MAVVPKLVNVTVSNLPDVSNAPGGSGAVDGEKMRQQYLSYLRVERRLSAHTILNYGRDILALLANDRAETMPAKLLCAYTPQDIKRALAMRHSKGLSPRSLARLLSAWRGFFVYAVTQGAARANPTQGLKPPKAAKTLIDAAKSAGKQVQVVTLEAGHQMMSEAPDGVLAALKGFLAPLLVPQNALSA